MMRLSYYYTVSTAAGVDHDATAVGCPHGHNSEYCCCSARSFFSGGWGTLARKTNFRACCIVSSFSVSRITTSTPARRGCLPCAGASHWSSRTARDDYTRKTIEGTNTTQAITAAIATSTANNRNCLQQRLTQKSSYNYTLRIPGIPQQQPVQNESGRFRLGPNHGQQDAAGLVEISVHCSRYACRGCRITVQSECTHLLPLLEPKPKVGAVPFVCCLSQQQCEYSVLYWVDRTPGAFRYCCTTVHNIHVFKNCFGNVKYVNTVSLCIRV